MQIGRLFATEEEDGQFGIGVTLIAMSLIVIYPDEESDETTLRLRSEHHSLLQKN